MARCPGGEPGRSSRESSFPREFTGRACIESLIGRYFDAPDNPMPIGIALEAGWTDGGLAIWRLTIRGAAMPGRRVRGCGVNYQIRLDGKISGVLQACTTHP